MKINLKNFNLKLKEEIPVDEFLDKALYQPNIGYYENKIPFGREGDFITAPTISNLFSEIIGIWFITAWESFGKPKKFNIVELGPGDGSLAKTVIKTFKKFPEFNKATSLFLYEKSELLKKVQKKNINDNKIRWIKDLNFIKNGPTIFFGNEFFDAIPIKQFIKNSKNFLEKCYVVDNQRLHEKYRPATSLDEAGIKSFKALEKLKFVEYPKLGFRELDGIAKKINSLSGGVLLIDYGYLNHTNENTIQLIRKNKKINMNYLLENLGKVDITSLVNFKLLKEYFTKNNLRVKKIVSQKFFLEKMGILERAKILEKNMNEKQKGYMKQTLFRLLHQNLMGELFKVIFAFKAKNENFLGFK
tara:strand:+ start:1225 stop:2301 length:1077 start_codon:yes stop_codon:yes gene_type:complete